MVPATGLAVSRHYTRYSIVSDHIGIPAQASSHICGSRVQVLPRDTSLPMRTGYEASPAHCNRVSGKLHRHHHIAHCQQGCALSRKACTENIGAVLIVKGEGNVSHQIRPVCPRSQFRRETLQTQDAAGACACHRDLRAANVISTTASPSAPR
jgi:hypothetical protein